MVPAFVWAPEEEGDWPPGAASRWWLHQSLAALAGRLREVGARLIVRRGPTSATLHALAAETGAGAVFWNRRYEPAVIARDQVVKAALRADGLEAASFNAALLHEPWTVANQAGKPFQVFTPFWRACLAATEPPALLDAPTHLPAPGRWPASLDVNELNLEPKPDWAGGLRAAWSPGEAGAARQLTRLVTEVFSGYAANRNRPDLPGSSRLSPHLHFGEIGPRQVWHALKRAFPVNLWRPSQFLAEIGWREFAHHLLYHFPHTSTEPLRSEFARFPWREQSEWLRAWQRGQTGYPLVDAGLRELWTTGWMHNRVRMVAASFLVKHLLMSWREGARWFWDTLVDADLANNTLGWQWTAGCGADAAPFFRVFNPVAQGEKFDPQGDYVRHWLPKLARLPAEWIHQPWKAPAEVRQRSGVELGRRYPAPIVNHTIARNVALAAYVRCRRGE